VVDGKCHGPGEDACGDVVVMRLVVAAFADCFPPVSLATNLYHMAPQSMYASSATATGNYLRSMKFMVVMT
jgi:hypothetical protein